MKNAKTIKKEEKLASKNWLEICIQIRVYICITQPGI